MWGKGEGASGAGSSHQTRGAHRTELVDCMSFIIGICIIAGLVAGGIAYLLLRRPSWIPLAIGIVVSFGWLTWFLHPVCVRIPDADLTSFSPPIDIRTDTGLAGQRYFQKRDGVWYQCKAWIARQLFF
jgi:hypothetical protein